MRTATKFSALIAILALLTTTVPTYAAGAWYGGMVKRIFVTTNGFVLTVESTQLNDCKHKYVYFKQSVIGQATVDRAYSLALLARSLDEPITFVIDKAINGPGGYCDGTGSMDMGPKG